MTRTLAISDTGLRLIKAFEGFRPDDRTLVTGIRVVGYGHRLEAHDDPVHMSRADAEEQLLDDLEPIEEIVNDEVHAPLTQGQFDALCSLAFNIGADAFRASDIVRAMNNGRVLDAANGFDVWRMASVNGKTYVVDALMRRRTAEKSLFLRHEPAIPAPSAMLQPQPDGLAPFGPTDDGLPKVTVGEASGVIATANIINADRVDPVDTPDGILTLSNLADRSDDGLQEDDFIDDDGFESDVSEDTIADDFEDSVLADDDYDDDDDIEDEDETDALIDDDSYDDDLETTDDDDLDGDDDLDDNLDDDDLDSDDDLADYVDELLEGDDALDGVDENGTDEDDADRLDMSALMPLAATDVLGSDTEIDTAEDIDVDPQTQSEDDVHPTTISSAATSLGDRLSALLDSDAAEAKEDTLNALPSSLLQPTQTKPNNDAELVVSTADEGLRSNLVSFPKRELVLDDPIETDSVTIDAPSTETIGETSGMLVIDDLAADDVIRASRDPENPVFDPEGDPVENAMRYLERQASEKQAKKSNGGMWIPIALGATLVGASAVLIGRGATQMLSAWGPTAVTAAAITGGLMVLFAIYAAARARST